MNTRKITSPMAMLVIVSLPATVFAHEAGPANFDELGSWWAFEPGVVIPLALSLLLYVGGLIRLRSVSPRAFGTYELACFITGCGCCSRVAAASVGKRAVFGAHDATRIAHAGCCAVARPWPACDSISLGFAKAGYA